MILTRKKLLKPGQEPVQFHLNLSDSGDANAQKDASEVESQPQLVIACPQASCRAVAISPDGRFLAYERAAFKGSGEP